MISQKKADTMEDRTEKQKETKSVETQFEPLYQASAETSFDVFHYVNKYL